MAGNGVARAKHCPIATARAAASMYDLMISIRKTVRIAAAPLTLGRIPLENVRREARPEFLSCHYPSPLTGAAPSEAPSDCAKKERVGQFFADFLTASAR